MLNFILFQLFSYSTFDIILQNSFLDISKKVFLSIMFYYDYLCNILMKNVKNKNLNDFYVFIFVIFGIFLFLYLYSFFVVTFKIIYTITNRDYKIKCIQKQYDNENNIHYYLFNNKNQYSILNELLKSKNYLFSI